MSERTQVEDDQDPAPTKHSDAQRMTESEAQQVPTEEEDQPERPPGQAEAEPE
jgi:hypothetical protein